MQWVVFRNQNYNVFFKLWDIHSHLTNEYLTYELISVGFSKVSVWGYGESREGNATWEKADADVELPDSVIDLDPTD